MESLRMVFLRIIWKDINTHNITKLTTQLAICQHLQKFKYSICNHNLNHLTLQS